MGSNVSFQYAHELDAAQPFEHRLDNIGDEESGGFLDYTKHWHVASNTRLDNFLYA
jgi:hypothetical protein